MSTMMTISYFVLWTLVVSLTVTNIRLMKPPGAPPRKQPLPLDDKGLPIGTRFPDIGLSGPEGEVPGIPAIGKEGTVLVITSTGCPACSSLYPELEPFSQRHPDLGIVVMIRGSETDVGELAKRNRGHIFMAMTSNIAEKVQAPAFPFTYLLSQDGMILAKGVTTSQSALDYLCDVVRPVER